MKQILFLAVVLLVSSPPESSCAADLGLRGTAPPPPQRAVEYATAPDFWSGLYIGGHLGGAFSGNNNFSGIFRVPGNERFLGGVQLGADYRFAPTWLIGVEGQYSWLSGGMGAIFPGAVSYRNKQNGIGSLTARLGYIFGPALVYAKGGYAFADSSESVSAHGVAVPFSISGSRSQGWTGGVGLEFLMAPDLSAKIEYQYYDFGRSELVIPAQGKFRTDDNSVKLGVNYRFNWAGPVVARF
ncbi:MAG: outer membrane beta-barrel protein [Alphaproteobacteria bacterium]|nr:outer membrane beta-barrel protein [Alphaproteobacteria bacterium]